MKKINTITIGIPAHNEEKNIGYMLRSILEQQAVSYKIEKIIVLCDGCTDQTESVVMKFAKKYKIISLINDHKRLGKAGRLNQIMKLNKSDYILFFDADIVLGDKSDIEKMVKKMSGNPGLNAAAGNQIPVKAENFINRIANSSFLLLKEMATINNGNHIHNLQGSASILRKKFAKNLKFPKGTITDQGFLYIMAVQKNENGFGFAADTSILHRTVSSLKDFRILAARAVFEDKQDLSSRFGSEILNMYSVPKIHLCKSILKRTLKDPVFTPLSIILNLIVRVFPYKKTISTEGKWEIVISTKAAISLN